MSLALHGETVTLTGWYTITRGYFKEYKGFFLVDNPDGDKPIQASVFFDERVAQTFREAGYPLKWEFSHKTHTLHAEVILGTQTTRRGERLCISHIYGQDGTVHEVPEKERSTKKTEFTKANLKASRMRMLDPCNQSTIRKARKRG